MQTAARFWIWLSAVAVGGGWILSVFHALNRAGYAVLLVASAVPLFFWWRTNSRHPRFHPARSWSKLWHRFKRPAPLIFLLMFLLNLGGGLVARLDNADSNMYRIPRVLHWLGHEGWHWIHTGDSRMNIAGCNFEWLSAPLILFEKTDRWVFLINICAYALLPGLVFSTFRRLRISPRVTWWWMWILSSGWCYVFQACSNINDSLGAVYALAAVGFALRAKETGKTEDLWVSLLAAGLLTGLKQTNLPLLLPCFVAAWLVKREWLKQPFTACVVGAFGLLISAATLACLNWTHTGSWIGFSKVEDGQVFAWGKQHELTSPVWGIIGNLFCLPAQNIMPPIFPWFAQWNAGMERFLQTTWGAHFTQFECFGRLGRSAGSGNAGIGIGVVCLTLVSVWGAYRLRQQRASGMNATGHIQTYDRVLRLLLMAPWISLLVFMAKVGTYENARQAAPYYALLFPLILAGTGHARLVRRRWWQGFAVAMMCFTLAWLGVVRGRELLPASVVTHLQHKYPKRKIFSMFGDYYASCASVESQRNFLQASGVGSEKIIGYFTRCGGTEPGWWMPFGQRRIERILADDAPMQLRRQGIHYVVVDSEAIEPAQVTIEQWADRYHGDLVNELFYTKTPNSPLGHLYLVHLRDEPAAH